MQLKVIQFYIQSNTEVVSLQILWHTYEIAQVYRKHVCVGIFLLIVRDGNNNYNNKKLKLKIKKRKKRKKNKLGVSLKKEQLTNTCTKVNSCINDHTLKLKWQKFNI